jgi:hypothetical protein
MLRERPQRPRGRRAANERDELKPPYSAPADTMRTVSE